MALNRLVTLLDYQKPRVDTFADDARFNFFILLSYYNNLFMYYNM